MRDLILDTGALIGLQRDPRRLRALIRIAHEDERTLGTTAPVLTEFLGGSPPAARAVAVYIAAQLSVAAVDEMLARRAATLIQVALDAGGRARPGAVDALAAAQAERRSAALVFDGDHADFEALARASGTLEIRELRELA